MKQGKRAQRIADSARLAHLRAKIVEVVEASDTLALDNARDRAQLVSRLMEALS